MLRLGSSTKQLNSKTRQGLSKDTSSNLISTSRNKNLRMSNLILFKKPTCRVEQMLPYLLTKKEELTLKDMKSQRESVVITPSSILMRVRFFNTNMSTRSSIEVTDVLQRLSILEQLIILTNAWINILMLLRLESVKSQQMLLSTSRMNIVIAVLPGTFFRLPTSTQTMTIMRSINSRRHQSTSMVSLKFLFSIKQS